MGGRSSFLTMWGLFFTTATFTLNVLISFFPKNSALRSFKKLSLAIALPVESAITSIYWPIIILNPKLMMPPDASMIMPLGMDLALHLYPALLLWIDYFAFSDRLKNPSNGKIRLTESIQLSTFQLTVLVTVAYVSRVELVCNMNSGIPCEQSQQHSLLIIPQAMYNFNS
ncbi:hypothetical protein MJO29_011459 [Puccinia striiformis f. sp. tritici]|nr:hypothetical protein MJO29_011459 [Puccinia striiformis f. sp. tritici]